MAADTDNGEGILVDKPERGAKEGYLSKYYNESNALNGVIRESNGISDHRIRLMTLKMIAGITDDTIRAQAFGYFEMRINKINDTPGISADEKNQLIANFCCGEMQGHIVSFYDQFLGITHRLKLGRV
jgi:hypothetical protein